MVMGEGHTGPTPMQSVNWSISSDVVQILADSPRPQLLHMPGFRIPAIAGRGRDLI